jgi:hypothetical protein
MWGLIMEESLPKIYNGKCKMIPKLNDRNNQLCTCDLRPQEGWQYKRFNFDNCVDLLRSLMPQQNGLHVLFLLGVNFWRK